MAVYKHIYKLAQKYAFITLMDMLPHLECASLASPRRAPECQAAELTSDIGWQK
jgi:hypothetical protein